jgi:small membrane protein
VLIQYLLLAAVGGFLVVFVRSRHGVRMQASKRVAFFVFLGANAYAVLRPNDVTRVAHLVGVGRGTDLLLYMLIVTFVFMMINFYLRMKETERRLTDLARAVAINDAEQVNRQRGLMP